jgi:hypothetical protein
MTRSRRTLQESGLGQNVEEASNEGLAAPQYGPKGLFPPPRVAVILSAGGSPVVARRILFPSPYPSPSRWVRFPFPEG